MIKIFILFYLVGFVSFLLGRLSEMPPQEEYRHRIISSFLWPFWLTVLPLLAVYILYRVSKIENQYEQSMPGFLKRTWQGRKRK